MLWTTGLFAAGAWQTLTNCSEVRQLAGTDSILYAATNGGVLRINAAARHYKKYTNTEGLAQIDVVAVAYDPRGYVWAAMPDGLLQIMSAADGRWYSYNEFQNRLRIFAVFPHQDFVLIASDLGVAELKLDAKQRWERTWKADIGPVKRLQVAGGYIWAVQSDGLRRISLDFSNKQIPNAWQRMTVQQGLPAAEINVVYPFAGQMVVGTQAGISFFDGVTWTAAEMAGHQVRSLTVWDGSLCLASQNGVYVRRGSFWAKLGDAGGGITALWASDSGDLWAATGGDGLLVYNQAQERWDSLTLDGPGSNTFSDLLIDRDGHLWAVSSRNPTGGVYYYNGKWHNFQRSNGLPHYDFRTIEEDAFGRIWAGSWGGGVVLFEKIGADSIKFTNLYAMDGNLSGIDANPNYVVITKIRKDRRGYLYLLNYAAANKQVLTAYDLDADWQHWTTADGIRMNKVTALAFDRYDRKWIGTEGNGISVLDDNNTPFDKSDDDLSGFLSTDDGLESNTINALVEDLDGTLWIGTALGLNYWFGGRVGVRYNVINDNILSLFVDPRNNKWIGTAGGLSVLDADNYTWTHYTTSNSPLVADVVTCFALNDATGEMYIGTTNGLSRLETPFTRPANNLNTVIGYPNPFIIDQDNARFYIDRLALNSSVRIFTTDGYLVKTIPKSEVLGARVSWDGRNERGEPVADGIYIYLVATKEGESKAGKVAVIRR